MHLLLNTWGNGKMDKTNEINGFQRLSWSLGKERQIRLSPFSYRFSLMCGRGNQTSNRVPKKWEELIRENSKSREDEKG